MTALAPNNQANTRIHHTITRKSRPSRLQSQTRFSWHRSRYWVIPPNANAAFVAAMEDVLEVYTRPHDPARPLVCLDETTKQLTKETRAPIPLKPGQEARFDYEYERAGVASLFMLFAPLEGWRDVAVRDRRTAIDYAHILRDLADIRFPKAEKIVLVQDNLNTHRPASLYEAFDPAEARRLTERFEWRYTPNHGSWLNIAECELSVLARQCLDRRIPDRATLDAEIRAWTENRNTANAKVNWHFSTNDARTKLKHLYPKSAQLARTCVFGRLPRSFDHLSDAGGCRMLMSCRKVWRCSFWVCQ